MSCSRLSVSTIRAGCFTLVLQWEAKLGLKTVMPDFVALGNEKIYCVGVGVCDGLTSSGSARVERGDAADLMYIDRGNTCCKALIAESVLS
jgi:hypothetical protein